MEAFQEAIRQGADGIEFDVRVSKDAELVIVHDPNLHRVAGDAHLVTELTADELGRISLRFGGNIPTLHDVTSSVSAPKILDMEIKHRAAIEPLISKLRTSAGLRERTIVSSFHASAILRTRRELPEIRTLFLIKNWPLPLRGSRFWTRLERLKPWGVALPLSILTKRRVAFLRSHGVQVGAWDTRGTIREARKARALQIDLAIVQRVKEVKIPLV